MGNGMFLKPYKQVIDCILTRLEEKKILVDKLPNRALSYFEIEKFARKHIPRFRGVFMRDAFPPQPPKEVVK